MKKKQEKKYLVGLGILGAALILLVVFVCANYTMVRDFMVGVRYQPSSEMAEIRTSLNLTDKGTRIFNASLPELMEKAEFNQKCREVENESAILGCYTNEKIYIYNIVDAELPGIRELATAHELLHAVYGRMSDSERVSLVEDLTYVFESNQELLGAEIEIYPVEQRQEELYVRAGTEISDLPAGLEEHFAKIFKDQDVVAGFYNGYIKVFREIEGKLSSLLLEIDGLKTQIEKATAEYEAAVASLNAKIGEFNNCAETMNCFNSTAVFNAQRLVLTSEQANLRATYNQINELISKCNALINEYNENVLHGQTLNMTINSSASVEEVED